MADTTPTKPLVKAEDLLKKLQAKKEAFEKVLGKKGFNPCFVLNAIEALVSKVTKGDTSAETIKAIDDIPATPKAVTDTEPEPEPKKGPVTK